MRDSYINLALLIFVQSKEFDQIFSAGEWVEDDRYQDLADAAISKAFDKYDLSVSPSFFRDMFFEIYHQLIEGGAITYDGDEYVSAWFRLNAERKRQIIASLLNSSEANKRIQRLGSNGAGAYPRALAKAIDEFTVDSAEEQSDPPEIAETEESPQSIPASDRLVSPTDNQLSAINEPLDEVIEKVESANQVGDEQGLRELILGKLRAGRELVRAGVFSLQSLQLTLVVGLRMLVEKHKDTTISVVASKLLDLLLQELGID